MASRLTEDKDVTVAVLEAGFNAEGLQEVFSRLMILVMSSLPDFQVFVPGLIGTGIAFTTLNWVRTTCHLNLHCLC